MVGATSHAERARARWGSPPDWIEALAAAADSAGRLGALAKRLSCSPAMISSAIGNTYNGKLDNFEARVRGALMHATVTCPVLGTLPRDKCLDHQAKPMSCANPQSVQLWRACRAGCAHARADRLAKGDRHA